MKSPEIEFDTAPEPQDIEEDISAINGMHGKMMGNLKFLQQWAMNQKKKKAIVPINKAKRKAKNKIASNSRRKNRK
jgi:hypothetical protein